jgi:hypothetical protein
MTSYLNNRRISDVWKEYADEWKASSTNFAPTSGGVSPYRTVGSYAPNDPLTAHTNTVRSLKSANNKAVDDIIERHRIPVIIGIVRSGRYRMEIGGVLFELSVLFSADSNSFEVQLKETVLNRSVRRSVPMYEASFKNGMDAAVGMIMHEMLTELAVFVKLEEMP